MNKDEEDSKFSNHLELFIILMVIRRNGSAGQIFAYSERSKFRFVSDQEGHALYSGYQGGRPGSHSGMGDSRWRSETDFLVERPGGYGEVDPVDVNRDLGERKGHRGSSYSIGAGGLF